MENAASVIRSLVMLPVTWGKSMEPIREKAEWAKGAAIITAIAAGVFGVCKVLACLPVPALFYLSIGYACFEAYRVFEKVETDYGKYTKKEFEDATVKPSSMKDILKKAPVLKAIYNSSTPSSKQWTFTR